MICLSTPPCLREKRSVWMRDANTSSAARKRTIWSANFNRLLMVLLPFKRFT